MRRLLAILLSISFTTAPLLAAAAPDKPKTLAESLTGDAKKDYDSGRVLINDGDFSGALIKYQAAYDLTKDPRLLWNIAACEKSLRHYARAVGLLKTYAGAGAPVSDKDKKEAEELIKTLDPFTVRLKVEINETDADVEIDDRNVGKSPLAPVVVDIGTRKVRVHKDGYRDYSATIPVGGTAEQTAAVKLEKELHEGKVSLQIPPRATVRIDGEPVVLPPDGKALEKTLASGGHTLRVVAPGMRVYEREIVINDNETRAIEVQLEPETAVERPELRVSVGCISSVPRGTEDGLSVFVDQSPAAAVPSGGKTTWNPKTEKNDVEYVSFPVTAGAHDVLVRLPGCDPLSANIDVDHIAGGDLVGALRSEEGPTWRGPAGKPNWGRVSIAAWFPSSLGKFNGAKSAGDATGAFGEKPDFRPSAAGIMASAAIVQRHWTLGADIGYASGSAKLGDDFPNGDPSLRDRYGGKADLSWFRTGFHFGWRIPFNVVAFSMGLGLGYDGWKVDFATDGPISWDRSNTAYNAVWMRIDGHVFCDWPVFANVDVDGRMKKFGISYDATMLGVQIGVAYQPNRVCRAERSTTYGLGGKK